MVIIDPWCTAPMMLSLRMTDLLPALYIRRPLAQDSAGGAALFSPSFQLNTFSFAYGLSVTSKVCPPSFLSSLIRLSWNTWLMFSLPIICLEPHCRPSKEKTRLVPKRLQSGLGGFFYVCLSPNHKLAQKVVFTPTTPAHLHRNAGLMELQHLGNLIGVAADSIRACIWYLSASVRH